MSTEPMDARVRRWVAGILQDHPGLVALAVRQRAKWEGWLKLELAAPAGREGFTPVWVEAGYGQGRSDVTLHEGLTRYDVELKTATANWQVPGVPAKFIPITKNIAGVVADARKLESAPGREIARFALFPVPAGDDRWLTYMDRIAGELGVSARDGAVLVRDKMCLKR